MSEERRKVLEMLASGKISAADAERLLDKLGSVSSAADAEKSPGGDASAAPPAKPRYLRIVVDKPGKDQVNLRVPISFLRAGNAFIHAIPSGVNELLAERGISLAGIAALKNEKLTEALQELNVVVDRADGKKVRIYCE